MSLTIEETYYVTKAPQDAGQHFIHSENCQVLPEHMALEELGVFETCAAALEKARERFDPVNACALCSGDCHEFSDGEAAA